MLSTFVIYQVEVYYNKTVFISKHEYLAKPRIINKTKSYA